MSLWLYVESQATLLEGASAGYQDGGSLLRRRRVEHEAGWQGVLIYCLR